MDLLRRAKRHLAWILIAKIGLIALLYVLFFSPAHRPDVDADAVGRRLESTPR
ncbi:cytochrome oxidase putative small subunit CydP [Thermomonas sp.]|uniref:cytochrome oxidase putative small subunit CydP n=1 Tax=Thermomonas sp. TaxID=1971895 RepID=UPI00391DFC59